MNQLWEAQLSCNGQTIPGFTFETSSVILVQKLDFLFPPPEFMGYESRLYTIHCMGAHFTGPLCLAQKIGFCKKYNSFWGQGCSFLHLISYHTFLQKSEISKCRMEKRCRSDHKAEQRRDVLKIVSNHGFHSFNLYILSVLSYTLSSNTFTLLQTLYITISTPFMCIVSLLLTEATSS